MAWAGGGKDIHTALGGSDSIGRADAVGVQLILAQLRHGRADFTHTIHAGPSRFGNIGPQTPDFLRLLRFQYGHCTFLTGICYGREVPYPFKLDAFAAAFEKGYAALQQADGALRRCGFDLPEPVMGDSSAIWRPRETRVGHDGHTAAKKTRQQELQDDNFRCVLSWLDTGHSKGWTVHYRPLEPLSPQLEAAFRFLRLNTMETCPEFDFEPCYWRWTSLAGSDAFSSNAGRVQQEFANHANDFSKGVEKLLETQLLVEPFGMGFLPHAQPPPERVPARSRPQDPEVRANDSPRYDVAISYAGTQRDFAERLATRVRGAGFRVFFDRFSPAQLWGKDLAVLFDDVYRKDSRFCVIFVSRDYLEREWTNHERQSAVARAIQLKGKEYVLPIKLDEVELPGVPPTIGYLSLREYTLERIAEVLIEKLKTAA